MENHFKENAIMILTRQNLLQGLVFEKEHFLIFLVVSVSNFGSVSRLFPERLNGLIQSS
jgi:hypothetical protein